jgi:hypothetical protein
MSMGGMVDPPPVNPGATQSPRLRVIGIAVTVIMCLGLVCYLVAWALL